MIAGLGTPVTAPIIEGLMAEAPDAELREKLMLFGQFIGDWEIDAEYFLPDGTRPKGKGEVHLRWILSGTAIQDVWSGQIENPPPGVPRTSFGTTVRFYDPKIDAWHCIWIAPAGGFFQTFVARQVGDEIVLEGKSRQGYPERWVLSEITPRSFRWRSFESHDDQKTWQLTEEMFVRKIGAER